MALGACVKDKVARALVKLNNLKKVIFSTMYNTLVHFFITAKTSISGLVLQDYSSNTLLDFILI